MDKLIKKTNLALVVGTNSWREQFIEAITVSAGEFGRRLQVNYGPPRSWSRLGRGGHADRSGAAEGKAGGGVTYSLCIHKTAD